MTKKKTDEPITPQTTAIDIFSGVSAELATAAAAQAEIQQQAIAYGMARIDKIPGSDKGIAGVIEFNDLHYEELRIYPLMMRRSRTMFEAYDGEDAKIMCASEDSLVPVSAEIAIARGFSALQDGPCNRCDPDYPGCRYQSFAWARSRNLKKPPCAIQLAILAVVQPTADPDKWSALTILRAKRASFGAASSMLRTSAQLDPENNGRRVACSLSVKTDKFGKKGDPYSIWSFANPQLDESPSYIEMFSKQDISAGLERLLRPYWQQEEIPDEWKNSGDDDLPF